MDIFSSNREKIGETTIVRPDFHEQTIDIARNVYVQVVTIAAEQFEKVMKVEQVHVQINAALPVVTLTVTIEAPVHYNVITAIRNLQQNICEVFVQHFTIEPGAVDVFIKGTGTRRT